MGVNNNDIDLYDTLELFIQNNKNKGYINNETTIEQLEILLKYYKSFCK